MKEMLMAIALAALAACAEGIEGEIRFAGKFSGEKPVERATVDIPWTVDLRKSRGIAFEIKCDRIRECSHFSCYFHSRDGWYSASFSPGRSGEWCAVEVDKASTRSEGRPGGWRDVDTVRVSCWRGGTNDVACAVRNLRALGADARVVVLRGESCAAKHPSEKDGFSGYAGRLASSLRSLGVNAAVMADTELDAATLGGVKVVMLPYNPYVPPQTAAVLGDFVKRGGRLFAAYNVDRAIAGLLGVKFRGWRPVDGKKPLGGFARVGEGLAGQPAFAPQASWTTSIVEPQGEAVTVARWGKSADDVQDIPALVKTPTGVYMGHVWFGGEQSPQRALMSSIIRELLPEAAAEIAAADARAAERDAAERRWVASLPAGSADEFRAFWCHSPLGVGGDRDWDESIRLLKAAGFNTMIANLLWGGAAAYPSAVLPLSENLRDLPQDRQDKFAECLAACRKHGVKLHVWKVCWNMGWSCPKSFVEKMKAEGRTQVGFDGKPGKWLCPSHPDNLRLETEAMVELAKRGPDGIHFDYIRYPDKDHCFCDGCRKRFEAFCGRTVADWPKAVRTDAHLAVRWTEFRCSNVTALVRGVAKRVRAEAPGVQISAAVFENFRMTATSVAQDWEGWCRDGLLDFVCPMDYCNSTEVFESIILLQRDAIRAVPVYPGIGLSSTGAQNEGRVRRVAEQILKVRDAGLKGFTVFNFDANALPVLDALSTGNLLRDSNFPSESAYGTYSRSGKITLQETNGVWRAAHEGSSDWALTAKGAKLKVAFGDVLRLACDCRLIRRCSPDGFGMSVVLEDAKGKVLAWCYADTRLKAGGTTVGEFAVPKGCARAYARIVGSGDAEFEVGPLALERKGTLSIVSDLPERWTLNSSALEVSVRSADAGFEVVDRRTGRTWTTDGGARAFPRFFVRKADCAGDRMVLELTELATLAERTATVALDGPVPSEFTVTLSGEGALKGELAFPEPFAARSGDSMILPLSEGFRLPMCARTMPVRNPAMWSSGMSMAFFGVEEDASGAGWMAIAETRDDAKVNVVNVDSKPVALGPAWVAQRGVFGCPRTVRYVFLDRGGYVAMAKRYRRFAAERGLVKTFREKAKERPKTDVLLGAANVWCWGFRDPSAFVAEMQAAGIERVLWSAGGSPETVKKLAAMPNVLVSRYDCYRDIYTPELMRQLGWKPLPDGGEICRNTSAWPHDVIWNSPDSNDVRRAWGVTCRDGVKRHCAAQCTACQPARARKGIARELAHSPYNTRFIDVTTAVGAEECANPAHPMTRSRSREAACELLGLLGKEFGLVSGSEQGIDWAVPVCDYFEGMLSPGCARMPHGRKGANRGDIFREGLDPTNVTPAEISRVVDYGLGEKYRIPLFELVYHDCCCAHWYWYDYSNRPIRFWPKRDLFNVLYGTSPMYIFDKRLWEERKDMFVRSYRTTGPVARRTGYSEMTDHRALTADRSVQRSTFADGTVVTVNFGDRPYDLGGGVTLQPLSHRVETR